MRTTQEQFLELCLAHGILAPESVLTKLYKELKAQEKLDEKGPTRDFIQAYCDAFKYRYGTHPVISGRHAGVAKRIVKELGSRKAIELVQVYLTMGGWYEQRRHDLLTFEQNLNDVAVKLETGAQVNRVQIRDQEKRDANAEVIRNYMKEGGYDPS